MLTAPRSNQQFFLQVRPARTGIDSGCVKRRAVHPGKKDPLEVNPERNVDLVGAGDTFTSVMILGLVKQRSLKLTLQRAQDVASKIFGQRGATVAESLYYRRFVEDWKRHADLTEFN